MNERKDIQNTYLNTIRKIYLKYLYQTNYNLKCIRKLLEYIRFQILYLYVFE